MDSDREVRNAHRLLNELGVLVHNWPNSPKCQQVARMAHDEYTKQLVKRIESLQDALQKSEKTIQDLKADLEEAQVDKYLSTEQAKAKAMDELAEVDHLEWNDRNRIVVDFELWLKRQAELRQRETTARNFAYLGLGCLTFNVMLCITMVVFRLIP